MNFLLFFGIFVLACLLSVVLTYATRFLALRYGYTDAPLTSRKLHQTATPLLGGVAVFLSFAFAFFVVKGIESVGPYFSKCTILNDLTSCSLKDGFMIVYGILFAGFVLVFFGFLDDKFHLKPHFQVIGPIIAAITVIATGIGQDNITNPFYYLGISVDPLLHLRVLSFPFLGGEVVLLTDLFTFTWLMILMYATKLLDGLNGLVSGIVVIGAAILFITSLNLGESGAAILAIIVAGAYFGFLPLNYRGKIFLGEAGSTLAGFFLGVLALIGPAKISITFLILGIPILDLLWVMYERKFQAKKSPFQGDLRHLHFKLLRRGVSPRLAVLILWIVSLCFGLLGLIFQGFTHIILFIALIILMSALLWFVRRQEIS